MPRPIELETMLTKPRIIEELECIEREIYRDLRGGTRITSSGADNLRRLRLAIEMKEIDLGY